MNKNLYRNSYEGDISSSVFNVADLQEINVNALEEERHNLAENLKQLNLKSDYLKNSLPYPDVGKYEIGGDYEDIAALKYKKCANAEVWRKIAEVAKYSSADSLYNGHLNFLNKNYYFLDVSLPSFLLSDSSLLVSPEDKSYNDIFKKWRFPKRGEGIRFSRNITIKNQKVSDVFIAHDETNSFFSSISDIFLRNVLVKNKYSGEIQSIIQTIQEEQNEIRTYDAQKSFVVQGCAGSGKTMVLLHRLKYLIYNGEINASNFVFLVPSPNFKIFINQTANKFGIFDGNISTYTDYYKSLLPVQQGKNRKEEDELNFPRDFLKEVYSKAFIQECYASFLTKYKNLIDDLIDSCDGKLVQLLEEEKQELFSKKDEIENNALAFTKIKQIEISSVLKTDLVDKFSEIPNVFETLRKFYQVKSEEIQKKQSVVRAVSLTEEAKEKAIADSKELINISLEIELEEKRCERASVFTKYIHKRKLNAFKKKYEEEKENLFNRLKQEEAQKVNAEIKALNYISDDITIGKLKTIIEELEKHYNEANLKIQKYELQLKDSENKASYKYSAEISALQDTISRSIAFNDNQDGYIKLLLPCVEFNNLLRAALLLAKRYKKYESDDFHISVIIKKIFEKSERELLLVLAKELLEISNKSLQRNFSLKLCKCYKHYWFLFLYFSYLIGMQLNIKKYIFIDEAQDLSPNEIELLYKCSKLKQEPVFNLFGDVKQVISEYGVRDWAQFLFCRYQFDLNDNFRNTDQIVEYCNKKVKTNMNAVGVSMEQVSEYVSLDDLLKKRTASENLIIIVKDEYAYDDLAEYLKEKETNNVLLYTVKTVKGLEFKEVCVIDEIMTENEKYISYTRALMKLNIVKNLPKHGEKNQSKIIQDEDAE